MSQITEIAGLMAEDEVVLFIGSGISIAEPSNLPSGTLMRDSVIHALCRKCTLLQSYEERLIKLNSSPEVLYQIIFDVIGKQILKTHMVFNKTQFNKNHLFVAHSAMRGRTRTIVTTNFDHLIEDALRYLGLKLGMDYWVYKDQLGFRKYLTNIENNNYRKGTHIIKLHGSIEDEESMIVTLEQTGKGLSKVQTDLVDYLLLNKHILVIGYSGNDLDLYPKLRYTKGRRIIWVTRPGDNNQMARMIIHSDKDNRMELCYDLNELFIRLADRFCFNLDIPIIHENHIDFEVTLSEWANDLDNGQIYRCVGYIFGQKGDYDNPLFFMKRCIPFYRKKPDLQQLAHCFNDIGALYRNKREYNQAVEYYEKSIDICRQSCNDSLLADNISDLSALYAVQGLYDKAMDHCQQALTIRNKINDEIKIGDCLQNIGSLYYYKGQLKKSLGYHKESFRIRKKYGNQFSIAGSLFNLAVVYRDLGEIEKSLICFNATRSIFIRIGSPSQAIEDIEVEMRHISRQVSNSTMYWNLFAEIADSLDGIPLE